MYTSENEHFEPKNGGGWKMRFLFNWLIFEVPTINLQVCMYHIVSLVRTMYSDHDLPLFQEGHRSNQKFPMRNSTLMSPQLEIHINSPCSRFLNLHYHHPSSLSSATHSTIR